MTGEFTGKHMALTMVCGFGIVIAVNLVMARYAISTFGGEVVENSYVASQKFNGWLDTAEHVRDLGWTVDMTRGDGDRLLVRTDKVPAGAELSAVARHPLGHKPDQYLHFTDNGNGTFLSRESLPPGRWIVRLKVHAGGQDWRGERDVQ